MSVKPPPYVARFDSATTLLASLAASLHGRALRGLGMPAMTRAVMSTANRLPSSVRRAAYSWGGWSEAVSRRAIGTVDEEAVCSWAASLYPPGPFDAVAIGSSNGAAVHLCAALGIPWLPQTFLVPVRRRGVHPDDFRGAARWARGPAGRLLGANPGVQLHHMHDPNQDRLMIRHMAYFRIKKRRLGRSYARFFEERVRPGGAILVVDCRRWWPVTRRGDRHVLQAGATGGLEPGQYLRPGERVRRQLRQWGSPVEAWDPPHPDDMAPEAEWGFEPYILEDIHAVARRRRLRVVKMSFDHPEDPSPVVADLYRRWYRASGLADDRLLVETFFLIEPHLAIRKGLVPLWLSFNVESSAAAAERYLDGNRFAHVYLTLFSNGIDGLGQAPAERWVALLARAQAGGEPLGADLSRYPMDFGSFVRFERALRRLPDAPALPRPLSIEDALDAVAGSGPSAVRVA